MQGKLVSEFLSDCLACFPVKPVTFLTYLVALCVIIYDYAMYNVVGRFVYIRYKSNYSYLQCTSQLNRTFYSQDIDFCNCNVLHSTCSSVNPYYKVKWIILWSTRLMVALRLVLYRLHSIYLSTFMLRKLCIWSIHWLCYYVSTISGYGKIVVKPICHGLTVLRFLYHTMVLSYFKVFIKNIFAH